MGNFNFPELVLRLRRLARVLRLGPAAVNKEQENTKRSKTQKDNRSFRATTKTVDATKIERSRSRVRRSGERGWTPREVGEREEARETRRERRGGGRRGNGACDFTAHKVSALQKIAINFLIRHFFEHALKAKRMAKRMG